VHAEAQPEVIRAVEAGTLAVSAAAKLAEKPVGVQHTVVKELESGAAKTVTAALKHTSQAPVGVTHLKRADAEWEKRLAGARQYFAKVEQSKLIEALGRTYADEAVGGWLRALEQLSTVARQLAERLQKAFQDRLDGERVTLGEEA
jgi:hypothetical protein